MVSICAHVPMSLPYGRGPLCQMTGLRLKLLKRCGSDSSEMLTGILGDELI